MSCFPRPRMLAVASLMPAMIGALASPDPTVARSGASPPRIAAAGDISCPTPCQGQRETARLIERLDPTAVLALGDTQYDVGALPAYRRSYDPTWGRFLPTTFPVPGNHEYLTPGAAGFFRYFGARTFGGRGFYSFDRGAWHIIALDSGSGGTPNRPQLRWLRRDLKRDDHRCELAYFHHPRWTSGSVHPPNRSMTPFWEILFRRGADVVLSGHSHNYERFAKRTPWGKRSASGIRQFVVGTGGAGLYPFGRPEKGSERRIRAYGVLEMTLRAGAYRWGFESTDGRTLDSGRARCHS